MTTDEERTIISLQQRGLGYKRISSLTGLPLNTVKAYCRRHKVESPLFADDEAFCRGCGKPIQRIPMVKPRQYCTDECRMRFWNSRRDMVKHKAIYIFQCPNCGHEFQSFGNPSRKYCSHSCANKARRKSDGR